MIDAPNYPEEISCVCIPPDNYPNTWSYNVWLQGQWSNVGNITKCINPNLCYSDPPALPTDFSVTWNQTASKPNQLNTTIVYSCVGKCKIILYFDDILKVKMPI